MCPTILAADHPGIVTDTRNHCKLPAGGNNILQGESHVVKKACSLAAAVDKNANPGSPSQPSLDPPIHLEFLTDRNAGH